MNITRRTALGAIGIAAASGFAMRGTNTVLRIAHLTDSHVGDHKLSYDGLCKCLTHAQATSPDFIFNGGDAINDAFDASLDHAKEQWQVWNKACKNLKTPIKHCLGNHDIGNDSKTLALDSLGLNKRYYSFEQAGWKFIILDSNYVYDFKYLAKLDDEQFDWLSKEVKSNKPILVLSHIPILSCCVFYDGQNEYMTHWKVPGLWMHVDSRKIKDLFYKSKNVKLCLSGHIHLQDRVEYLGTTYICGGAVSGAWWDGDYQECHPGYGLVDLNNDGSFSYKYLRY